MLTKVATPVYTFTVGFVRMEWIVNLLILSEGSLQSQHQLMISAGLCLITTIALLNRVAGTRTTSEDSPVCGTRLENASLQMLSADTHTRRRQKWRLNVSLTSCLPVPMPTVRTSTQSIRPTNTSDTKGDLLWSSLQNHYFIIAHAYV